MSWFYQLFNLSSHNPPVSNADSCFTANESKAIHRHFLYVLNSSKHVESEKGITSNAFLKDLCCIPELGSPLSEALFKFVTGRESGFVYEEEIKIAKAKCERSGEDASYQFGYDLLRNIGASASADITKEQLRQAVKCISKFVLGVSVPDDQINGIVNGAFCLRPASTDEANNTGVLEALDFETYRKWSKFFPAVHSVLSSLLLRIGSMELDTEQQGLNSSLKVGNPQKQSNLKKEQSNEKQFPSQIPSTDPSLNAGTSNLLQPLWLWMLSSSMDPEMRKEWRLVFSSHRDGHSFQTMMGNLTASPEPSLLIIRDKGGNIFGCFAPQPWQKSGAFYGDFTSFVFSLHPMVQVFRATGANTNFQWCGMGFTQLPNGLGMGGAQMMSASSSARLQSSATASSSMLAPPPAHFAVYVDSSLDKGVSRPIATFGNPSLASAQVFDVDALEVWTVKAPEEEEEVKQGGSKAPGSILDQKAQDRAFLDMAGVNVNHSAGLRDPRQEE